MKNTKEEEELT